jgi:hypothetical protein
MSASSVDQGLMIPTEVHSIVKGVDDALELAKHLLKSGMLPAAIRTPEAALVIILTGRELGIGPMMAFQKINVIQGKPTIAPELMLALARRQGLLEDLKIEDDGNKCTVTIKRKGNSPVSVSFSMADAESQGLAGKDNWRKMPAIMRQWRTIAAGCRLVFSDVIGGLYTPEELGAEMNEEGDVISVTPTVIQESQPAEAKPEPVTAKVDKPTPNTATVKETKTVQNTAPVRPYEPEVVKQRISEKAASYAQEGKKASEQFRGLVCGVLEMCFEPEDTETKKKKRHSIFQYLVGKDSAKDIPDWYFYAIRDWLNWKQDSGGMYIIDSNSIKEAHKIIEKTLLDAGQQKFPD